MTQDNSAQQANHETPSPANRRAKIVLLIAVLIIGGLIYFMKQTKDPQLNGWGSDLAGALARAAADNKKVVVLFTREPMSETDKQLITVTLTHDTSVGVLDRLKYPLVHLSIQANAKEAEQYKVTASPVLLLLDADGKVAKRQDGFVTDLDFCNNFLNSPIKAN